MGLVFFGMGVMSDAMAPLRAYAPFIDFIATLSHPLSAALVGAVFTAIIQSSAATTGIVIVLAGQGLIDLETAIAVALGANIGTCATAGLAVIGKPREAVRAALVHVLFNVAGVLIWIGLIPLLAQLVQAISPGGGAVAGTAAAAAAAPRQIANAHTIFNVANTLIFIGFTPQIARLVERLVPDRPLAGEEALEPKFLDDNLLSTPAIALENVRHEIGRMGDYVHAMLADALPAILGNSRRQLEELEKLDKPVDRLHRAIIGYLGRISLGSLSSEQARVLMQLVEIANDLEHIADRVATDMVTSARKRIEEHALIRPESTGHVRSFHQEVSKALAGAVEAVTTHDPELAAQVRGMKREVSQIARDIERESFRELPGHKGSGVLGYVREVELLEILDGIFKIARRIARSELNLQKPGSETAAA
jgi:phosphate:Na+ symporter